MFSEEIQKLGDFLKISSVSSEKEIYGISFSIIKIRSK